jgi:hypothetical protein
MEASVDFSAQAADAVHLQGNQQTQGGKHHRVEDAD